MLDVLYLRDAVAMRPLNLRLLISAAICCLTLLSTRVVLADDPSIELRHLGFARDKHWNDHLFWMKLSNPRDKPLWFVLPWSGNRPLPEKTIFRNERVVFEEPLSKIVFDDEEEGMTAVGVSCGVSFRAFRLPKRSTLEIPQYNISSKTEFGEGGIVVMDAEELLVNGKVPLEKWVPFRAGIYKQEKRVEGESGKQAALEAENGGSRPKVSRDKVKYIEAQGDRRWTVKFQPKGEFNREQRKRVDLDSSACHIHLDPTHGAGGAK